MKKAWIILILIAVFLLGMTACKATQPGTGGNPGTVPNHQPVTLPLEDQVLSFSAQYVRTDGGSEEVAYPSVKIVRSLRELNAYREALKDRFDLAGFSDACDRYNEAFFQNQFLLLIRLEEGSGSIRHSIRDVSIYGSELYITLYTYTPEIGTDDMAQWHILLELDATAGSIPEANIHIQWKNRTMLTMTQTVQYTYADTGMSLELPENWEYEIIPHEEGCKSYGIRFWHKDHPNVIQQLRYYQNYIHSCGTELRAVKTTVGRLSWIKFYHGDAIDRWHLLLSPSEDSRCYAFERAYGSDTWWAAYGETVMQILHTVKYD